jgi:hypothetical protein
VTATVFCCFSPDQPHRWLFEDHNDFIPFSTCHATVREVIPVNIFILMSFDFGESVVEGARVRAGQPLLRRAAG